MTEPTHEELAAMVRSAVSSGIKDALHDREELLCAAENAAVTAINR